MNYATLWRTLARRAVRQGGINAESFIELAEASGMSIEEIERRLLEDLANDGPIFGAFMRSLTGAATQSVLAAERQGAVVASIEGHLELERLLDLENMEDVIDEADPEELERIENGIAERVEFTWVATLVNTCERCLPLHGHSRTLSEWNDLGFSPETIHDGWTSACHCQLVPTQDAGPRDDLVAPLVRVRAASEQKGVKRTARAVAQKDLDRAVEAAARARESEAGRRALRALGKANADALSASDEEKGAA